MTTDEKATSEDVAQAPTPSEMEETRLRLQNHTRLGSAAYQALTIKSGEMLAAAVVTGDKATVIFRTKYTNKPGTRTLMLNDVTDANGSYWVVALDVFAAAPVPQAPVQRGYVAPVMGRTSTAQPIRTGPVTTAPDEHQPPTYQVWTAEGVMVAEMRDEVWARRFVTSCAEFQVRLIKRSYGVRDEIIPLAEGGRAWGQLS